MQQLSIEVQQKVAALQQLFLNQQDGPDDRRQINVMLRRLELRIHLDQQQQQVGLSIADGPVEWQPLNAALSRITLHQGGYQLQVGGRGGGRFNTLEPSIPPDADPQAWSADASS